MHLRPLLLCAVVAAGIPLTSVAVPLWTGDLETGDLSQWSSGLDVQAGATDRLLVVANPSLQGTYAMKVTVKPGDLNNGGNRAEVVLRDRMFHQGDEVWFHWYTLFPSDYVVTPKWTLFTQWHSGNPSGVPLGFNLHGTRLSMRVMGHKYDAASDWSGGMLWTDQLVKGQWMEFLVHVKWSDGNDGFVEVWKDRKLVVPKTYHPTLDTDDYVYLKQGFYRDKTIDYTQTIYHDGMTLYDAKPLELFETTTPTDAGTPDAGSGPKDPDPVTDAGTPTDPDPDPDPDPVTDAGTDSGNPVTPADGGTIVRPPDCSVVGNCEQPHGFGCGTTARPRVFWTTALVIAAGLVALRRRRRA